MPSCSNSCLKTHLTLGICLNDQALHEARGWISIAGIHGDIWINDLILSNLRRDLSRTTLSTAIERCWVHLDVGLQWYNTTHDPMLWHLLGEHLGDSIDACKAWVQEDSSMHGQLGVKGIDQCHGVHGMSTGEVNHVTHHQDAIVHSRVRSMSTHHSMGYTIRAVEMVQCFSTPFGAHSAVSSLSKKLSGQTLALAIGHQEGASTLQIVRPFSDKNPMVTWVPGIYMFSIDIFGNCLTRSDMHLQFS